jgi:hypothetical protein
MSSTSDWISARMITSMNYTESIWMIFGELNHQTLQSKAKLGDY